MSLLQALSDFFESLFKRSSPEVQKKQLLRKLDSEIKSFQPCIFKEGMLQPNFGEAIYTLYKNTRQLDTLFSYTVSPNDIPRQHRFEAQLILTAYSRESQQIIESLSYENRKNEILENFSTAQRFYIKQKQLKERIIKELNTEPFRQMDKNILTLRQLVEFCQYNFVPFMQTFDTNFIPADFSYIPHYQEVPVSKALNLLEDLYYQTSNLRLTTSTAEMVTAIAKLRKGGDISQEDEKNYLSTLKKINFVLAKILSPDKLKLIIRYAREDLNYEPAVAAYSGAPRQEFANMFQTRFDADEQRIKSEIQDEKISEEVQALFGGMALDEVGPYNQHYNNVLQNESNLSFQWVLPIKIIKTFLRLFLPSTVKSLLNDIVIEGFFNNPSYKSTFSTIVYGAINAESELTAFEESFGSGQKNSIAIVESYIKDSKKDRDFYKKLEKMVIEINNDAYTFIQSTTMNLFSLYKELGELLADAKKPSSEIISNLKVLVMSSRNKDNTNFLEESYDKWKIFFDIMKNYVIINGGELNHE